MRLRWFVGAGLAAALVAAAACGKRGAGDEILVGEYGSLTGTTATFGQSTHNGVKMAVDEINAAGGVLGKKLKLYVEDDQGKPEEAATAVTKLITQNHVVAMLGEVASSRSLAAAPIAQAAQIPMITPSSTNPRVTAGRRLHLPRLLHRSVPGRGDGASSPHDSLKLKKVAILVDVRNDYSVGLPTFFRQHFKQLGGEIVAEQSYSEGDSDFHAQLTQIKAAKPEAIFVPGYYTEVGDDRPPGARARHHGAAARRRRLGLAEALEIGGEALNGCYFSNHYSADDPRPWSRTS